MMRNYFGGKFLTRGFLGVTLLTSIVTILTIGMSGGALHATAEPRPASSIPPCLQWYTLWGNQISLNHEREYDNQGYGITLDKAGNIYVTGCVKVNETSNKGAFLAKFNTAGDILWNTTWQKKYYDNYGLAITLDCTGNVYVAGSSCYNDYWCESPESA